MCEEIGKIAIGTYDGLLLCYRIWHIEDGATNLPDEIPEDHQNYHAHLLFAKQPHDGSVRSLAGASRYLASGGPDGAIALFDLKQMRGAGYLSKHEDAVDNLEFFQNSYLISASTDKTICLWRTSDASMMKVLTGHTAGITAMAISPTGKFMLSAGKDGALRMWDLMRGHNARTRQLGVTLAFLAFSEDSTQFVFGYDREVQIVTGQTETTEFTITHEKPVTCCSILGRTLWVGCADGHLYAWNMDDGQARGEYVISQDRIKMVHAVGNIVITMTSAGNVMVGVVDENWEVDSVLSWDIDGRITCGAFMPKCE